VRILIVSHAPLDSRLGAPQIALQLADALRAGGAEVVIWSAETVSAQPWWSWHQRVRQALELYLATEPRFDIVDLPAPTLTARIAASARTIARSVQPDHLYHHCTARDEARRGMPMWRRLVHRLAAHRHHRDILRGWRLADRVLLLGEAERGWVGQAVPALVGKLSTYWVAPIAADREKLALVRSARSADNPEGSRFLWLGRWVAHKGPRTLVEFLSSRLRAHPNDAATIAGTGCEELAELPRQLVESRQIRVIPQYSRDEMIQLLAGHDVGLFTSEVEGWGIVLQEMLEAGLTVYATRAGAVTDLEPYFPHRLRPFPPPPGPIELGEPTVPDRYLEDFDWHAIGAHYLGLARELVR
jgi:glycosyltransferase involved in cell wall biosynthesis